MFKKIQINFKSPWKSGEDIAFIAIKLIHIYKFILYFFNTIIFNK